MYIPIFFWFPRKDETARLQFKYFCAGERLGKNLQEEEEDSQVVETYTQKD